MARYVLDFEFGIYEIIIAMAMGGKTIGTLGLDLTLIQILSTRPFKDQRNAMSTVLFTRLVIMCLFTILFYLIGALLFPFFDDGSYGQGLSTYRWILPTIFVLMSFRELFLFVLQGLQQFRNLAMIQTASAILKFSLIWFLAASLNLTWLLIIEIIMLSTSTAYLIYLIPFRSYKLDRITLNADSFRDIFKFGFPIYINAIVNYVSNFAGTFIIGGSMSTAAVAQFSNAGKMPQGVGRLFDSFRVVYFPTLSQLFSSGNKKEAAIFMNKTLVILASVTFAGVIVSFLFSEELVQLVLGDQYQKLEVRTAFVLLMLAVCLRLLASTMGYSLVSSGNPQKSTQVNIVSIVFQLVMLAILIPVWGFIGAAIAMILMQLLAQSISYFMLRSVGARIVLREYLKPYVLLIGISALYFYFGFDSYLYRGFLVLLYVGLCIALIDDCRVAVVYLFKMVLERRKSAATT